MHLPTIIILSVVTFFLTCSDASPRVVPPETPSQVVSEYVSFARAGEFDKVASLTVSPLQGKTKTEKSGTNGELQNAQKESNSADGHGLTIVSDEKPFAEATLDWVRNDFAKSIFDEKYSIKVLKDESANEHEARVEINLGSENRFIPLAWIFSLRKVNDKWKIYDISTAGAPLEPLQPTGSQTQKGGR